MIKEELNRGDIIENDGVVAYIIRPHKTGMQVWINNSKVVIPYEELKKWKVANPIKDNRLVSSKTFAIRLKSFIEETNVNDPMSKEEKDYLLWVAEALLKSQIATVTDSEEIDYLKRLKLL